MTQHTPGPWRLCAHLKDGDKCSCGYRGGIFGPDDDYMICEMGSTVTKGEEGLEAKRYPRTTELSNARLIACAPEMLDALERIKSLLIKNLQGHESAAFWIASTAISKATGET